MAVSAHRKHTLNRLKALVLNLEKTAEDFTLDKSLDRMVEKLEFRMNHFRSTHASRKARAERSAAQVAAVADEPKTHDDAEPEVVVAGSVASAVEVGG